MGPQGVLECMGLVSQLFKFFAWWLVWLVLYIFLHFAADNFISPEELFMSFRVVVYKKTHNYLFCVLGSDPLSNTSSNNIRKHMGQTQRS